MKKVESSLIYASPGVRISPLPPFVLEEGGKSDCHAWCGVEIDRMSHDQLDQTICSQVRDWFGGHIASISADTTLWGVHIEEMSMSDKRIVVRYLAEQFTRSTRMGPEILRLEMETAQPGDPG